MENEDCEEIVTPFKDIKDGQYSYTVARVLRNDQCAELHYDNGKSYIEYMTRVSPESWEGTFEDIEWFNLNLSEEYVLGRLNVLYEQELGVASITEKQADELNLLDKILYDHKVYDIELYINSNNELVAYDDANYWHDKDFYDFIFNELVVLNKDGSIDLISPDNLKKLEKFREERTKFSNKMILECYKNLPYFYQNDIENFYILKGIYSTFPDICDNDCLIIYNFCLKNQGENINVFELSKYITNEFTSGNITEKELKMLENKDINELPFYDNLNHFYPVSDINELEENEK